MARDTSFRFNVPVTVIRDGFAGEERFETKAAIWQGNISLPIKADVEVGDVIQRELPNGKTQCYLVTAVNVLQNPFRGSMDYTEVKFTVLTEALTRSKGNLNDVIPGKFKKTDLRYLAAALAEGVTQDQLNQLELDLPFTTEGSKIKRASAIVQHFFNSDDPDGMFLRMLDFIYFENPYAEQALSSAEYRRLDQNVLKQRNIELGDNGYYVSRPYDQYLASGDPVSDSEASSTTEGNISVSPNAVAPKTIFIVHGHDVNTVNDVRIKVNGLTGIMPEILADSAGRGDTIIEKFERRAAESDYAIVVLTPDDEGRAKNSTSTDLNDRARQNVILELGYFYAKLGRDKVAVIHHAVELPSDIVGVNYIQYGTVTWLEELREELKDAGFKLVK
ncbi:hypothetical protein D7Z96_05135 [Pseudarthrobacter phenanthrenivorans]|uniref:CD-NTase-associated protein 12/Pycsar effector protein TIR domain-containing protein n=1 Tax=Pseudarthrobacter phenanthrenivorans TaxID=361575 RepID=A0A3B0G2W6_PSEPS|nr:nucleotide-binding protein [Pseudarthrobacter phenanthrenivorans]RKO26129.1 hypothetical protein D7Z96_05135 [Pseudarthrobacter phenanthrenivorans]